VSAPGVVPNVQTAVAVPLASVMLVDAATLPLRAPAVHVTVAFAIGAPD
jgi:hypothetical protein